MSVLVFEHVAGEDTARLGAILGRNGHRLRVVSLHEGGVVPVDLDDVDGLIVMGGPMNVDQTDRYPWMEQEIRYVRHAHGAGVPIVGVCLGAQMIATALGGTVAAMPKPEAGWEPIKLAFGGTTDPIFAGIGWETVQFHLHGQAVTKLPPGSTPLASSEACRNQAFRVGQTTYAFQYHFEWDLENLKVLVQDPMVTKAGLSPDQVIQQGVSSYYDDYRRLGDRLGENLAINLLAVAHR